MKKISIIIVLYNSDSVIEECLNSISKFEDPNVVEVILVDNNSDSNFNQEILKKNLISIKYLKSKYNGGFGYGNNLGVSIAKGEILFFLNPDTILTESISNQTIKNLNKNNVIVGYSLIDLDGKMNNTIGLFPQHYILSSIIPFFFKKFNSIINFNFFNKMVWPWGAAFSIKKETFLKHGKFDEKIFLCNEEPDLLIRIRDRKIIILKNKIIHLEGHTTINSSFRISEYLRSSEYYFKKHKFSWKIFKISLILKSYIKAYLFSNKNSLKILKTLKNDF